MSIPKDTFQRITEWTPAYNRIAEGYGRHGMELRFVLVGEKGAVQFVLYTNWDTAQDRFDNEHGGLFCPDGRRRVSDRAPMPADLGYHALAPRYEDQSSREKCPYLGDRPCYYDGSGLNAEDAFDVFTDEGEEALWTFLERYYDMTFNDGDGPPELGRRWERRMQNA